jgi:hypothetical protein
MRNVYSEAEGLLASQEGVSSMELPSLNESIFHAVLGLCCLFIRFVELLTDFVNIPI